jgi:hypothetical protein
LATLSQQSAQANLSGPFRTKGADGPLDILEGKLPQNVQRDLEPPGDGLPQRARNKDPTRRCLGLQASRHIYGVAVDVVALNDDIAEVKADPEHDGLMVGLAAIGLRHRLLEFYGRGERVHRADELNQRTVALRPDHPPSMAADSRCKPLVQVL